MRATVLRGSMLEALTKDRTPEQVEFLRDVLKRGFASLLDEGQQPQEVYHAAIPVFGENLLIEAGIVELCLEREEQ